MKSMIRGSILANFLGVALLCLPLQAEQNPGTESVDFARQILPLLSEKCFVEAGLARDDLVTHVLEFGKFTDHRLDCGDVGAGRGTDR